MGSWDTEYPRPQLRRESFLTLHTGWKLNGRAITLPWPPQAALAEYAGPVGERLEYETSFVLPWDFVTEGHRVLLHFDAVDQVALVELNGKSVIRHEGGYLPFGADITDLLREGENSLAVHVKDPLSHDFPYGKQHAQPHGMWYTAVSGIWRSVWLEAVPEKDAVMDIRVTPGLAGITLEVDTTASEYLVRIPQAHLRLTCRGRENHIAIPNPHLWTPEDPFLYDLVISTDTDRVRSYFALRTVTMRQTGGQTRLCLNGEPLFLHGVLDQGYFQDGLFLPADPEEYERDIHRMKELGYNTLRKHVKVEPEAFYFACDRLGMLVLQDMVNSGSYDYVQDTVLPTLGLKKRRDTGRRVSPRRRQIFERHVSDTLCHLYGHPCIIGYTIFNEGWGQYDSDRIYRQCKQEDPTRFFVSTSGWFAQKESDVQSEHVYFRSRVLEATRPGQFLLLSECGGFSRRVEGHVEERKKNYGYGKLEETEEALTARICALYREMVLPSIPRGLCGCIYTQLSDVEGETNGLYTWDREVCKVEKRSLQDMAAAIQHTFEHAVR